MLICCADCGEARCFLSQLESGVFASVVELVYTSDLKSDGLTAMRVQVPPLAPFSLLKPFRYAATSAQRGGSEAEVCPVRFLRSRRLRDGTGPPLAFRQKYLPRETCR